MLKSSTVKLGNGGGGSPSWGFKTSKFSLRKPAKRKPAKREKTASNDPRFVCPFTVGQMIQHNKRPTIRYMLINDPVQVRIKRGWRNPTVEIGWKFKLFSVRGGKLGGRMMSRVMSQRLVKDYFILSDVELSGEVLAPDGTTDLLVTEMVVSHDGDSHA